MDWQHAGRWDAAAQAMTKALVRLREAGADFGVIATNTMHLVFKEVQAAVGMPLLSIVDATAEAVRSRGVRSVGLLGTAFTMGERFFRDGLEQSGVGCLVPESADQTRLNEIIYQELCRGDIRQESRQVFLNVIEGLRERGAQGIILGCTEIPLIVRPADCDLPLFNTTILHAERALDYALGEKRALQTVAKVGHMFSPSRTRSIRSGTRPSKSLLCATTGAGIGCRIWTQRDGYARCRSNGPMYSGPIR